MYRSLFPPDSPDLFNSTADLMDEYPSVPTSIAERYKVGRTLGDGNFAVVRECLERSTGREYALKIISKDKCRGKVSLRAQFLTEIIRPPFLVSFSDTKLFSVHTVDSLLLEPLQFFYFLHRSTDGAIRLNSWVNATSIHWLWMLQGRYSSLLHNSSPIQINGRNVEESEWGRGKNLEGRRKKTEQLWWLNYSAGHSFQ